MLKRIAIRIVVVILIAYTSFGTILYTSQNSLLYPADKTSFYNCPALGKSLKMDSDGFRAYYTKRSTDKVIVYYHGNGGRACDRSYMDNFFGSLGYSTLLVEYPGYAESGVTTSINRILAEVSEVNKYINNQKFKEVIAVSESVGTGPATYQTSLKDSNINKLVLITPYTSMVNVAFHRFPFYPMKLLVKDNFTPDLWLSSSTIPTTIILAENDEVIGAKEGQRLFDGLANRNKKIFTVKDSGHNSIYEKEELYKFLEEGLR